ncbi:anhydro-N-acetylmuramic acid kinase [Actinobacillus suis]|uniref:Anhydro-N-acetylmuramic acid kinase n=2 Tax=Actinobacillus suis TaxID=716 RepID=K0G755_ACTSU|nr:anhydro-N-acetylmuramic acid kinase [Actinobacillus suis]AFU20171.1 anhydro-N-acetylmuramic acid kinase [Actinobacillus suis H91-0380]AIJ32307.1 anhydro-N-acetylmuramic acid kinase [Actinobacillus suis ATCC 33415]MCO4169919.1 anhydro-N-acetylmuramic acid kinase [Actinobacillus suis]MCQ9630591.1 anhydro-N-acetylmuramic acid kinase [Actinobacillus suis]MCQ9632924.1 anhydro-N-acetylmuramic acid kinase [Actinobacillus suis]
MTKNLYLGVMSGTSLDGVDLCVMDFAKNPPKLTACSFTPMPEDLRTDLSHLLKSGETSLQKLGEIDHRLGLLYAESINRFLVEHHLTASDIQAIGCHGQTVWHSPNGKFPFTMQIGDMNLVAAHTGITTIADFRRKDMAVGGQGAPLVPAFHEGIFASPERLTVVLNIGGISNISVLAPQQPTIGYDVSVGNALMDSWIELHQAKRYDKNAEWAKTGTLIPALLNSLLDEPFFKLPAPKSTGRELFNLEWLAKKSPNLTAYRPEDVQRTLAEFTAQSVVNELKTLESEKQCLLLVCGGGARNPLLMQRFSELLPKWQVATTDEYGLDIDYVEAAAFAWLAYQRVHNLTSNLPSVTGAKQPVSLGVIYPK